MCRYTLSHLGDGTLLRDLHTLVARDRAVTADLLAHLAEVDERKLYLPAAYPSMYAYCVSELGLCEQAAFRRIRAARAARRFPALFPALAEGRLTLSAVLLLAPHLSRENAGALIAAATRKNRPELERLLAERFPRPDLAARVEPLGLVPSQACQLSPATVAPDERGNLALAPDTVEPPVPRPRLTPLAPERYALQVTLAQTTYDKLLHARALLGHAVPSGDLSEVLDRALEALIERLERRKCATVSKPRKASPRPPRDPRHIPAQVRRTVWERDGGRCTFVSEAGHRCGERARLELDHIEPLARGGQSTVEGLRLRCRAHNQYAAECVFGAGFMDQKRRARRPAPDPHETSERGASPETQQAQNEVIPWLRALGIGANEAREVVAKCAPPPDAPLEERLRLALRQLGPPRRRIAAR